MFSFVFSKIESKIILMKEQNVYYDFLADWCDKNHDLVQYVKIEWASSKSETKRSNDQLKNELRIFLEELRKSKNEILKNLEKQSNFHGLPTSPLYFNDKKLNFICRKCSFINIEIYNASNCLLTQQIVNISKKEDEINKLLNLFTSEYINNVKLNLKSSFFEFNYKIEDKKHDILVNYMERESKQIEKFPKPDWTVDFPLFFISLVGKAKKIMDNEMVFIPPFESEDILSRCLTCVNMPFFNDIQLLLKSNINDLPASIMRVSKKIIQNVKSLSKSDLSLGYQLLYRNIFEIYLINNRNLWPKSNEDLLNKIRKISTLPASKFNLLPEYLNKDSDFSLPINLYVQSDKNYSVASNYFSSVLNCSNPLDMLYRISKTILQIKSQCFYFYHINTGKESPKYFSFDTIFTIFFMIFLGSEIVDIFAISEFIHKYAPKQLSTPFKFSKMLTESLSIYCKDFNIDSFLNST